MCSLRTLNFSELEKLLAGIEKPGRYLDNEFGVKSKSINYLYENPDTLLSAVVFPDIYEIGMSNLGIQILYEIINKNPGFSAERVFSPWPDFEDRLRKKKVKIFSLENRIHLDCFDLIGFSVAHEMLYTNILNIIDLSGLKIRSTDRADIFPIICAGGTAAVNPWPLSKFIDFFVIGDGEEVIIEILKNIRAFKKSSLKTEKKSSKESLLKKLSAIDGIFIPGFYKIHYSPGGRISKIEPDNKVKKAVFAKFRESPIIKDPIVANIGIVHDRFNVEIMRGCARGCRFCQAGFVYRPVRQKNVKDLVDESIEGIKNTGYDEISFTSLSTSDYRDINALVKLITEKDEFKNISISLPSLRLDSFNFDIAEKVSSSRRTGLTFAPEAGSQRMRDIIKKDINEKDLLDVMKMIFEKGWYRVKLYFMAGLPFETEQDIQDITGIIKKVVITAKEVLTGKNLGRLTLSVSINGFCPKPFTPFQWHGQESAAALREKFIRISEGLPKRFIKLNYSDPFRGEVECALSRGDSRVADVVEEAWKTGARFDNWTDIFDYDKWIRAFRKCGLDINFYTTRNIDFSEILPWDIIDVGVSKAFFKSEYEKAKDTGIT